MLLAFLCGEMVGLIGTCVALHKAFMRLQCLNQNPARFSSGSLFKSFAIILPTFMFSLSIIVCTPIVVTNLNSEAFPQLSKLETNYVPQAFANRLISFWENFLGKHPSTCFNQLASGTHNASLISFKSPSSLVSSNSTLLLSTWHIFGAWTPSTLLIVFSSKGTNFPWTYDSHTLPFPRKRNCVYKKFNCNWKIGILNHDIHLLPTSSL